MHQLPAGPALAFLVPVLHPGIPVNRTPCSIIQKSSPSVSDCVAGRRMSGAFGNKFRPISVSPLPSLA